MKAHVYASNQSSRFLVFFTEGSTLHGTNPFDTKDAAREHLHSLGYVRMAKPSATVEGALESWKRWGGGLCYGCAVSPERRRRRQVCANCNDPGRRGPEHAATR